MSSGSRARSGNVAGMVDPTLEHQSIGLSGRGLCFALFAKYSTIIVYGIAAIIFEVPTFVVVGSSLFALVWASLVTFLAALAALGVARTWTTGRFRLEKWTTALFILAFLAYSFALVWRSISTGNTGSLPLAVLPLSLCILPIVRYYSLVLHHVFVRIRAKR